MNQPGPILFAQGGDRAALKALDGGFEVIAVRSLKTQPEGYAPDLLGARRHGADKIWWPQLLLGRERCKPLSGEPRAGSQGCVPGVRCYCVSLVDRTGLEVRSHPRDKLSWRLPASADRSNS